MASSAGTAGEQAPDDLAVQVPLILGVLDALGIAVVGHDGYEADDVIGTLASTRADAGRRGHRRPRPVPGGRRRARRSGCSTSPAGSASTSWSTTPGSRRSTASRPRAYVDYATLRGDASDGLPGVAGIGEKTAASLLNSYGDLDDILAAASRPAPRSARSVTAKLGAGDRLPGRRADRGRRSPATSTSGVSWDDLDAAAAPANPERFAELTELLGLGGSADRILARAAPETV